MEIQKIYNRKGMIKVLFIGNYLSKHYGTNGPIEKLAPHCPSIGVNAILASGIQNKYLRLVHMCLYTLFCNYKLIHIDVYSGAAFRYALFCSKLSKFRKKTVIINLHGGMLTELFEKDPNRINKLFENSDHILTPSLFLQDYFQKQNFKVHYLPNAIDFLRFPFKRDKVKPYSLLWVRAFDSIYSPEVAINSLLEVKKEFPSTSLTMIGPDKGKRSDIEYLIKKNNLQDSVTLTGAIPNTELFKYYQTHQVFLNTTQYESFGVCITEAASCGIPIISNNVGEISFLWENETNCLLVEKNSIEEFSKYIKRVFNESELNIKLSEKAKFNIEKFKLPKIILKWKELFQKI